MCICVKETPITCLNEKDTNPLFYFDQLIYCLLHVGSLVQVVTLYDIYM